MDYVTPPQPPAAAPPPSGTQAIHATLISFLGVGCLIVGPSGSGKSRLAAESLLLGGKLVADDKVFLSLESGMLMGAPAKEMIGVVELRGVGLYKLPDTASRQVIHVGVELVPLEQVERLPARHTQNLLGVNIPVIRLPVVPHTNALFMMTAVRAVQEGRILPTDWRPGT